MQKILKESHTASLLIIYEGEFSPYYKHNLNLALNIYIHTHSIYGDRQLPRMGVFIVQFKLLIIGKKVADGSLKKINKIVADDSLKIKQKTNSKKKEKRHKYNIHENSINRQYNRSMQKF